MSTDSVVRRPHGIDVLTERGSSCRCLHHRLRLDVKSGVGGGVRSRVQGYTGSVTRCMPDRAHWGCSSPCGGETALVDSNVGFGHIESSLLLSGLPSLSTSSHYLPPLEPAEPLPRLSNAMRVVQRFVSSKVVIGWVWVVVGNSG